MLLARSIKISLVCLQTYCSDGGRSAGRSQWHVLLAAALLVCSIGASSAQTSQQQQRSPQLGSVSRQFPVNRGSGWAPGLWASPQPAASPATPPSQPAARSSTPTTQGSATTPQQTAATPASSPEVSSTRPCLVVVSARWLPVWQNSHGGANMINLAFRVW